jgi:hypothetical protein
MNEKTATEASKALTPATSFFSLGADLLGEVQKIIGTSKVKALRLKIAGRHLKDVPVNPATAIATVLLVVAAVIITNLRIEVIKESVDTAAGSTARSGDS